MLRSKPDFQPTFAKLAHCIDMQERWACAALYLYDSGDNEGASEAIAAADLWRDRAESIECEFRSPRPRP